MRASIVDLRYRMKDVLAALDNGEVVTVLYRGKERARLTSVAAPPANGVDARPRTEDQPFFGMWSDKESAADPARYVRELRRPRRFSGRADGSNPRETAK